MDPMAVPRVSFANEARGRGFERVLKGRNVGSPESRNTPSPRRDDASSEAAPAPVADGGNRTEPRREKPVATPSEAPAQQPKSPVDAGEAAARQVVGTNPTAPERGRDPGKPDAKAPEPAPFPGATTPAALALEDRLRTQVRVVPAAAGVAAVGATTASGGAAGRPASAPGFEKAHSATRTERPAATTPSFRTFSKQTLELAEQARDSVFKQIAFRLSPEHGEMRMLLDPPELGQLDVRLTVDQAGKVTLNMLAERPELAVMLDKHMPELTRALAQSGLTVHQAAVEQQSQEQRRQTQWERESASGPAFGGIATDHDLASPAEELARRGFYSAEGFDFWV